MKRAILAAVVAALTFPLVAPPANAGPIGQACMGSDRKGANRANCECIDQAADMTLSAPDQRRAAKFFSDPDEAQRVRISDRSADEAFWDRYKAFGEAAATFCAG